MKSAALGEMLQGVRTLRQPTRTSVDDPLACYWALDTDALLQRLGSSNGGLSAGEAARRLREHGSNVVLDHVPLTRLRVVLAQLRNALLLVLMFAAIASALTGEWIDASIVLVIVVATDPPVGRESERDGC